VPSLAPSPPIATPLYRGAAQDMFMHFTVKNVHMFSVIVTTSATLQSHCDNFCG